MTVLLLHGGLPPDGARAVAAGLDATMADCILDLYRSAVDVAQEWGAAQAGASVVSLDGTGHWWMLEDPEGSAEVLRRFWAGLD